jgi:hypothetical protein
MNDVTPQPAGPSPVDDPKKLRAGYFQSIFETAQHIRDSVGSEGNRLRNADYISIICLPVFSLILAVFATNIMLTNYRPIFVVAFFLSLLYFIGARIGVLRALSARHTHLIFNVLLATFMLGCTFALLIFEIMRTLP